MLGQVSSHYVPAWSLEPKQWLPMQDFRHCSQIKNEGVSDFIVHLEKTFCLAYGHKAMSMEMRNTLLCGQLHEGLAIRLMEAHSVSGVMDYACLCMAARNEERHQAELQRSKAYETSTQQQSTSESTCNSTH